MAIVASDMATAISTRFEALFVQQYNQSLNVSEAQYGKLLLDYPLGDNQGDTVDLNWLGASPQLREWVDEKQSKDLNKYELSVKVKPYEATVRIDLNTFRDAKFNIYEPRIRQMAQNGTRLSYNLLSALISGGAAATCYDGQNFFDTDHSEGDSGTQSNKLTGTGTTVAQLTADFYSAKAAIMGFKDDKGEVLHAMDFRPLLWIPNDATLIQNIEQIGGADLISNTSNVLKGRFDYIVDPKLTDANDWYMFLVDEVMKPFIRILREDVHYEDNFGTGHPDVWSRRVGEASAVGRQAMTYGLWQCAVQVTNA